MDGDDRQSSWDDGLRWVKSSDMGRWRWALGKVRPEELRLPSSREEPIPKEG